MASTFPLNWAKCLNCCLGNMRDLGFVWILKKRESHVCMFIYDNTGCQIFKWGVQNWKDFCLKINIQKGNWLNFENWCNGEVSNSAKIRLSKSIFYVKNHPNLSQFCFHLKNINLGAHFLLLTFIDIINF